MWEWMVVREGFLEKGASLDLGSVLITLPTVWMMNCWRESLEALKVIHIWGRYDSMQRKQWVCSGDWIPADWLYIGDRGEGRCKVNNQLAGWQLSFTEAEWGAGSGPGNDEFSLEHIWIEVFVEHPRGDFMFMWVSRSGQGAWQATVHGIARSQTRLKEWHFHFPAQERASWALGACGSEYDNPEST